LDKFIGLLAISKFKYSTDKSYTDGPKPDGKENAKLFDISFASKFVKIEIINVSFLASSIADLYNNPISFFLSRLKP